jgi:hypothetical protein
MLLALREGFRSVGRSWGLVVLLLGVNISVAGLLAVPLAGVLERDLAQTEAASNMLYGFDFSWWQVWSEKQDGWTSSFGPRIFGTGFAFSNVDSLLRGSLPAGLFSTSAPSGLDPVILGLGAVYLFVQVFLTGGILGVLRGEQGVWTFRGLLHGSGFYFGRFLRVSFLALVALWVVFRLDAPLARWAAHRARESVSETTGMIWLLGSHGVLLLAILFVHMLSSYARVIVVVEERASALLAFVSSLSFCLGNLARTASHYLSIVALAVALLLGWGALDGRWGTTGYRTQLVALVLAQALIAGRIALRLGLLGGQLALYRRLSGGR